MRGAIFAAVPGTAGAPGFRVADRSPSHPSPMVYDGTDLVRVIPHSSDGSVAPSTTADLRCDAAVCAVRLVSSGTSLDLANNDAMFDGARGVASDVTFHRAGDHRTRRPGIDCLTLKN